MIKTKKLGLYLHVWTVLNDGVSIGTVTREGFRCWVAKTPCLYFAFPEGSMRMAILRLRIHAQV